MANLLLAFCSPALGAAVPDGIWVRPGYELTVAVDAVQAGRITVPDLYTLVLGPFLTRIGSSWSHGTESVWQEHLASHVVLTVF